LVTSLHRAIDEVMTDRQARSSTPSSPTASRSSPSSARIATLSARCSSMTDVSYEQLRPLTAIWTLRMRRPTWATGAR